jgi:polyferredoxin
MFFIVFILEVFGLRKERPQQERELNLYIYGFLLLALLSIGVTHLETLGFNIPLIGSGENLALLLGIIFIFGIFYFAYKSG